MKVSINGILLIPLFFILISPCLSDFQVAAQESPSPSLNHNPILFIHGWRKDKSDFDSLMEWFRADGWSNTTLQAYNFDERNNCSVPTNIDNANRIQQWVDTILAETGAAKIDLVAHSMGGLSSRYYLKFLNGIAKVDDYVSLGSPHHGEDISACGQDGVNALALLINEGDETPGGLLDDTLGDREDPVSGVIYNGAHVPGNVSYTSIYSRDDAIPYISPPLDGAKNVEVQGLTHSQLYQDEGVYELIRAAVDDSSPAKTSESAGWGPLAFLGAMSIIICFQRKK
ncbi:MAG: esterase/lipase family protein [Candidatus Thorarchaeota archaeon]